jgi:hypothetical protein
VVGALIVFTLLLSDLFGLKFQLTQFLEKKKKHAHQKIRCESIRTAAKEERYTIDIFEEASVDERGRGQ